MRVLHVVPTYLPAHRYGGPIVSVHGLCKALVARGHEVHVFTTNVDGSATLDVPIAQPISLDGVTVRYFPSTLRRIYRSPMMASALASSTASFDIVHSHAIYLWPGLAAAAAAKKGGAPHVISPRGMLVPELIAGRSRIAKAVWIRLLERGRFAKAAAIHFTSELERDDARRTGIPLPSSFVVPNGTDLQPRPLVDRAERTLLFLGRVTWKKGLDKVIKALPSLGARLIVAGNDEENLTPKLRELAAKVGAQVDFRGPVHGAAKFELLASATLFVLLSTSENFGNAVLEAMSMQTPVVLSRGVGLADHVVAAGAGIIGLEEVQALLNDPARRQAMGRRGRALVESRFGWPRIAAEMEQHYFALR